MDKEALSFLRNAVMRAAEACSVPADYVEIFQTPFEESGDGWAWQVRVRYEYRSARGRKTWMHHASSVGMDLDAAIEEVASFVKSDPDRARAAGVTR